MSRWLFLVPLVGLTGVVLAETEQLPQPMNDTSAPRLDALPEPTEPVSQTSIPASLRVLNELKALRQEVQLLRNEVEQQGHDIEGLKRRQRDMYLDIDRRLSQAGSSGEAFASSSDGESGKPKATPAKTVQNSVASAKTDAESEKQEQERYSSAFQLVKDGHYEEAIVSFRAFLQDYPQSKYSDNAQYWIAECFYVTQKYDSASTEFNKVIADYPDSTKVSGSLLKIGIIHLEKGENDKAKEVLTSVVDRYPNTTVSQLALNRLKKMAAGATP